MRILQEEKALRRIRHRDERALAWFIDQYGAYVQTIIRNIARDSISAQDMEELTADVFFTLWQKAEQICPGKAKGWLASVARNKTKNLLRNRTITFPLEDDLLLISDENIEHTMEEKEKAFFIRRAVLSMQQPDREIFLRYYYYYQSIQEIAQYMQMNPATVKTHLHRGRGKLKDILIKGGYHIENTNF